MRVHLVLLGVGLLIIGQILSENANAQSECSVEQRNNAGCGGPESCVVREDKLGLGKFGPECEVRTSNTWVAKNCFAHSVNFNGERQRSSCWIWWTGPITRADADKLIDLLDDIPDFDHPLNGPRFVVESDGGDVYAALALGRKLRSRNAAVSNDNRCASACVYLLAAGVSRSPFGDVVIHRPYSLDTSRSDLNDLQRQYDAINAAVAEYLRDMNLPASLLDAMLRVPPHQGKRLTWDELDAYGLSQRDPVYEQAVNAVAANRKGMTMTEYLGYKRREEECIARYGIRQAYRYCDEIWPETEESRKHKQEPSPLRDYLDKLNEELDRTERQ